MSKQQRWNELRREWITAGEQLERVRAQVAATRLLGQPLPAGTGQQMLKLALSARAALHFASSGSYASPETDGFCLGDSPECLCPACSGVLIRQLSRHLGQQSSRTPLPRSWPASDTCQICAAPLRAIGTGSSRPGPAGSVLIASARREEGLPGGLSVSEIMESWSGTLLSEPPLLASHHAVSLARAWKDSRTPLPLIAALLRVQQPWRKRARLMARRQGLS